MALNVQQAASQRPQFGEDAAILPGSESRARPKGNQETWEAQASPIRDMSGDSGLRLIKVPWPVAAVRSHHGSE